MKTADQDPGLARPRFARAAIAWMRRHLVLTGTVAAVGTGLAIFVLAYFQPQKLFIDDRVNEPMPSATAAADGQPEMLPGGAFRGLAHAGSGDASILRLADGRRILRFENFTVENGPDLFVYLSSAPAESGEDAFPGTFVDLGRLKGNIGSQNYEIASTVELARFTSVVIYCKRFSTPFAVAPLA